MREPSVRLADWSSDANRLMTVRRRVFIEEQSVPESLEWDGADPAAVHFIAEDAQGHPVGTARLLDDGHVGRMAVLPQWRRRGVASALLRAVMHTARARGLRRLKLNAQTQVVGFYEQHGFLVEGDEFQDAGIPHRPMARSLEAEED